MIYTERVRLYRGQSPEFDGSPVCYLFLVIGDTDNNREIKETFNLSYWQ